jgi:hypothetical protein
MRTFHSIALVLVSVCVAVAVVAQTGPARAQQPAASQPRQFADRASEGAGATHFRQRLRSVSRQGKHQGSDVAGDAQAAVALKNSISR